MKFGAALLIASIAILAFCGSASAFECKSGRYVGKTWSAVEKFHNKEATLLVSAGDNLCTMRFKCAAAGADEIWELSGNKLTQRELDANGKEAAKYGATLEVRGGVEGYYVNCTPLGCDGGTDPRSFWKIDSQKDVIVYSAWGADPLKLSDEKTPVRKRFEYKFSPAP